MKNGTNAYNYCVCVPRLEVGHSRLMNYACQVADAIGYQYGPIHGEYMVDENGPVLIEVNCRPMGAGMPRKYVEQIFGEHETDAALDAYLSPEAFEQASLMHYRINQFGAIKIFILPTDTEVYSAPILQIATHLKSYYASSFDRIGRSTTLSETKNLETAGGTVFLLHENEQQVRQDLELLHQLEMNYPRILFQASGEDYEVIDRDIPELLKDSACYGATAVFTDSDDTFDGAVSITNDTLSSAYDSYEQGILDLSRKESFRDLEGAVHQIYTFASKVRKGGRIIVPESTYCHLPYGIEGMEILLRVAGLRIELPLPSLKHTLIASVE